jgi:hypothetical protein
VTIVLPGHPPWRRLLVAWVSLPLFVLLAVLAFAWPAARVAPRDLPIGVVGTGASSQAAVSALTADTPGAFDLHLYADDAAARAAIRDRAVYGAFETDPGSITVLEAGAAGPTVAQLLTTVGQRLGEHAHADVDVVDVVPLSADDPHGSVFASAMLPITICGVIVATGIAVLFQFRPAWRQLLALTGTAAVAALGVYLVAQGVLGALPHEALATWAALALAILAISVATAGLVALLGVPGAALAALTMVFLGNPFSGVNSAPDLLPGAVAHLGQWLPPGAAANLLRSTAYFAGHGAGGHVAVLVAWAVVGAAALVAGHRRRERVVRTRDGIPAPARYVPEHESVAAS